ncbi:MAG TPA: hypothetical protein VGP05_17855 [Pseudonocardia sp.]|nr:hypothetical protein [Pseudonocardia sp.]
MAANRQRVPDRGPQRLGHHVHPTGQRQRGDAVERGALVAAMMSPGWTKRAIRAQKLSCMSGPADGADAGSDA